MPIPRTLAWQRAAALALVLAAGIALRTWVYGSKLGAPDSDEAIVGLMIRHALHGEIPTFYWGNVYGGPQEVLLGVPLFAVFGQGLLQLRAVSMTLSALAALLVWRVGRRTIGELPGAVAGALLWVWPPYLLLHLTREYGFYGTDLVYCALLLLLALRIVERPSHLRVGAFGLALGLAFWQTAQIVPIAVPAIAWTAWRRPQALRHLWLGLLAAAAGASPWLVWNVRHDWASLLPRASLHEYVHNLRLLASPLLPMLLGLRAPFTQQLLLPKLLVYLVYVALLAAFALAAWRQRRRPAGLVYAVALVFPFVWAVSRRVGQTTSHPVFLLVVAPVVVLLLAHAASTRPRALAIAAACLAVSVISLQRMETWLAADRPHWPTDTPRSLAPLVASLDRLHVDRVYAQYWIAYRLSFASHERVLATENEFGARGTLADGHVRPARNPHPFYPPYQRSVDAASRYGFVMFRSTARTSPLVPQLRAQGFRASRVGPFVVYAPTR